MHINCDMNNHTIYGYTVTNAVSLSFCMVEHTQSSVNVGFTQPCPVYRTTQFTDQQVYMFEFFTVFTDRSIYSRANLRYKYISIHQYLCIHMYVYVYICT